MCSIDICWTLNGWATNDWITQKMIRVRTRVSAISRRHPTAGLRVTWSGSGGSQVRQYRLSDPKGFGPADRLAKLADQCRADADGRFVGFADGRFVGLADGLAEGPADGLADGLASSGCLAVGRMPRSSIGQ